MQHDIFQCLLLHPRLKVPVRPSAARLRLMTEGQIACESSCTMRIIAFLAFIPAHHCDGVSEPSIPHLYITKTL